MSTAAPRYPEELNYADFDVEAHGLQTVISLF